MKYYKQSKHGRPIRHWKAIKLPRKVKKHLRAFYAWKAIQMKEELEETRKLFGKLYES